MTIEQRRRFISRRRTAIGTALVAAISFLAGMTDAVGLLIAGNFVSFMSGNTTRAAVAVADWRLGHALVLFGALLIFVAGNAMGTVVAHKAVRRTFNVMVGVTVALLGAAMLSPATAPVLQFYAMVLAMGMINAAVEQIEGRPIGLTYVTGALSRFGRGLGGMIVGDPQRDWVVQILPWLGMAAGALCGAGLAWMLGPAVIWLPCGLSALLAVIARFIPSRFQKRLGRPAPRLITKRPKT
ncbi:YoaK family protein [Pararhizobium gei]|uniref:YoaK family protein n=1 Tax=Pararhizobium gei TaxID=1395951 RepID=UPI0023DB97DA|nr:YoaK family protein [Rhizobium gei]